MANISIGGRLSLLQRVASLDLRYGPYSSIADAYENMGPSGDEVITAGLPFGVTEDDGSVSVYIWTKGEDATQNDCRKLDKEHVILFNGFIDISVSIKQQSYNNVATKNNIVFLNDRKQFAYRDGLNFYINWKNRYVWSNENLIPYDDVIYIDINDNKAYYYNGTTLTLLVSEAFVSSINNQAPDENGNVNITKENIGLGNVDNTADEDKIVKGASEDGSGNVISSTYETKADATTKQTGLQQAIANLTGLDSTNFGGFSIQSTEADAISNIATLYTADGYTDELLWYMAGTSLSSVKAYRYNGSGTPTAISSDTYNCVDFSGLIADVSTLRQDLDALGPKIDKVDVDVNGGSKSILDGEPDESMSNRVWFPVDTNIIKLSKDNTFKTNIPNTAIDVRAYKTKGGTVWDVRNVTSDENGYVVYRHWNTSEYTYISVTSPEGTTLTAFFFEILPSLIKKVDSIYSKDYNETIKEGGYITCGQNISIGDVVNPKYVAFNNYGFIIENCEEGESFVLTLKGNTVFAKAYVVLDKDNKVVQYSQTVANGTIVNIGQAGVKIIINTMLDDSVSVIHRAIRISRIERALPIKEDWTKKDVSSSYVQMIETLEADKINDNVDITPSNSFVIRIATQNDFNGLQNTLASAVSDGNNNITVLLADGKYYYNENHLNLNFGSNVNISIVGSKNVQIMAGGKDYNIEDADSFVNDAYSSAYEGSYSHNYAYVADDEYTNLNNSLKFAKSVAEIVEEEYAATDIVTGKIKVDEADLSEQSASDTYVLFTEWFKSEIYKVAKIENGYLYFKLTPSKAYGELWVNQDYRYSEGKYFARYSLINQPNGLHIRNGQIIIPYSVKSVHECRNCKFINMNSASIGNVLIEGITFIGAANNGVYGVVNIENSLVEKFIVRNCQIKGIRSSYFVRAMNTQNVIMCSCSIELCDYGIFYANSYSNNAVFAHNSIQNVGCGITNKSLVTMSGANSHIHHNVFKDYGGGPAISFGAHYQSSDYGNNISGIIEFNSLIMTDDYVNSLYKHGLMDSGAIYAFTIIDKCIIRHNFVYNYSNLKAGRGIYCDDGAKNCKIYGNLILLTNNNLDIDSRLVSSVSDYVPDYNQNNIIIGNIMDGSYKLEGNGDNCFGGSNVILSQFDILRESVSGVTKEPEFYVREFRLNEQHLYLRGYLSTIIDGLGLSDFILQRISINYQSSIIYLEP